MHVSLVFHLPANKKPRGFHPGAFLDRTPEKTRLYSVIFNRRNFLTPSIGTAADF